ncbi:hypothetical protein ACWCOT_24380 [Nonomuraea bangladeshensis]
MELLADLIPLAVAALNLASVLINRKIARRHRHPAHGEDKGGCQSLRMHLDVASDNRPAKAMSSFMALRLSRRIRPRGESS